jgi:hypothetical protein
MAAATGLPPPPILSFMVVARHLRVEFTRTLEGDNIATVVEAEDLPDLE